MNKDPSYRKTSKAYRVMVKEGMIVEPGRTPSVSKNLREAARKARQGQKGKRKRDQDSSDDPELAEEGDGASSSEEELLRKVARTVKKFTKLTEVCEPTPVPLPPRSRRDPTVGRYLSGLKIAYIHNASALAKFQATVIAQGVARRVIEERTQPLAGPSRDGEGTRGTLSAVCVLVCSVDQRI